MSQLVMGPMGRPGRATVQLGVPAGLAMAAAREASGSAQHRLARVRWSRVAGLLLMVAALAATLVAVQVLVLAPVDRASAGVPVNRGDGAVVVGSGDATTAATALHEHVVAPGDTLWGLAATAAPDQDPREMVDRIMRLNGLDSVDVQVGHVLLVPNG